MNLRTLLSAVKRFSELMLLVAIPLAKPVLAQSPADGPWSGTIQCDLNVQEPNYERQETQTWTLTGKKLGLNGDMRIFDATWTATGRGRNLRSSSSGGQQLLTQWTINVPATSAPLSFWVHQGEPLINFKQWHSLLRADNAVSGAHQGTANGVPQPQQPFSGAAFEWNFGFVSGGLLNPGISGSKSIQVEGLGQATFRPGLHTDTAACQWNLTKGASGPDSKNNQKQCAQEEARITQTFDAMEADTRRQFDALIQQTQDPAMIASLRVQEQNALTQLETERQGDLKQNTKGCKASRGSASTSQNSQASGNGGGSGSSSKLGQGSTGPDGGDANKPPDNAQDASGSGSSSKFGQDTTGAGGGGASQPTNNTGDSRTAAPQLLSVTPPSIEQGASNVQVTLAGRATTWQKNVTQLDLGPGIAVSAGPFFTQSTEAVVIVNVAGTAAAGPRAVTVTTNNEHVGLPAGLTIVAKQAAAAVPIGPMVKDVTSCRAASGNPGTVAPMGNNHSARQATVLTPFLGSSEEAMGNLISSNDSTYYTFNLRPDTHATVTLSGLGCGSDYDLYIYKNYGPPYYDAVASSKNRGTAGEQASVDFDAAGFVVEVRSVTWNSAAPNYTLTVAVASGLASSKTASRDRIQALANPGALTTAAASAPSSGQYLVTITGLRCGKAILDDPFDRDGKGDEVYAAAYVRRYDRRTGDFLEQSVPQTAVYGDTRNFPDREQAGSLSPTGGIGDFDSIPPNASADRCCVPDPARKRFPLLLWQGSLTDGGDVLIISPSVWESDGDPSWFYVWGEAQHRLGESLLSRQEVQDQISRKVFGPITLGATGANSGNLSQAAAGVIVGSLGLPMFGLPVQAFTGGFKDRPIGLVPNGVDATALPNTTIVLTREIIETALSSGHLPAVNAAQGVIVITPKPGIMVFNFADTFKTNDWSQLGLGLGVNVSPGLFTMILQVERQ